MLGARAVSPKYILFVAKLVRVIFCAYGLPNKTFVAEVIVKPTLPIIMFERYGGRIITSVVVAVPFTL